jgi:hypothetical protein
LVIPVVTLVVCLSTRAVEAVLRTFAFVWRHRIIDSCDFSECGEIRASPGFTRDAAAFHRDSFALIAAAAERRHLREVVGRPSAPFGWESHPIVERSDTCS